MVQNYIKYRGFNVCLRRFLNYYVVECISLNEKLGDYSG